MERSEAKLMPTISTNSSSTKPLTLLSLNYDEIWMILAYLPLRDVLMVDEAIPAWNYVTTELLFKQQVACSRCESHDYEEWPEEEYVDNDDWDNIPIYSNFVPAYPSLSNRASIPKDWLKNDSLTEWKILLERCPNLSVLYLYGLRLIGVAQFIQILDCILRLCKNVKDFAFHYYPAYSRVERVVKIDMSNEKYMFDWIPSWGSENKKEIILTTELLEHCQMTNGVLDYVQGIFADVGLNFRGPYWCSMMFEQCILKDENSDAYIVVARLQCTTLGICRFRRNEIMEQWKEVTCHGHLFYTWDGRTDDHTLPNDTATLLDTIENICSLLRKLDRVENFERDLFSLHLHQECKYVTEQPREHHCGCRCCFGVDWCKNCYACGRKNELALEKWNRHWKTVGKPNWDYHWSEYEDWSDPYWDQQKCGRRSRNCMKIKRSKWNANWSKNENVTDIQWEKCGRIQTSEFKNDQIADPRPGGKGRGFKRIV